MVSLMIFISFYMKGEGPGDCEQCQHPHYYGLSFVKLLFLTGVNADSIPDRYLNKPAFIVRIAKHINCVWFIFS